MSAIKVMWASGNVQNSSSLAHPGRFATCHVVMVQMLLVSQQVTRLWPLFSLVRHLESRTA
jgi:hypothetical protein